MFINEQEATDRLRQAEEIFASLRNPISPTVDSQEEAIIIEEQTEASNAVDAAPQLESEVDRYLRGERYSFSSGTTRTAPLHDEARAGIAMTSMVLGSTRKGAALFDVAQTTACAHTNSKNSPSDANGKNGNLSKLIERNRNIVMDKATARMLKCLDLLDDDKLENLGKATEISRVAVDMSRIIEKVTPKDPPEGSHVHFHIFSPQQADEKEYNTIDLPSESVHVSN